MAFYFWFASTVGILLGMDVMEPQFGRQASNSQGQIFSKESFRRYRGVLPAHSAPPLGGSAFLAKFFEGGSLRCVGAGLYEGFVLAP